MTQSIDTAQLGILAATSFEDKRPCIKIAEWQREEEVRN